MTYKMEWNGTKIEVRNGITRCELSVDGKTQDFYDGIYIKKDKNKPKGKKRSTKLKGVGQFGNVVEVEFIMGNFVGKINYYYDGRLIKSDPWII